MIAIAVTDYPAGLQSWEAVISSDSGFFSEKDLPLDFPVQFDASGKVNLVVGYYIPAGQPREGQFEQQSFKFTAVDGGMYKASLLTGLVTDFWPKDTVEKTKKRAILPPVQPTPIKARDMLIGLAVIIGIGLLFNKAGEKL